MILGSIGMPIMTFIQMSQKIGTQKKKWRGPQYFAKAKLHWLGG